MTASYLNCKEERFFVIEDYEYQGFGIQIDRKESTGEFYGKLYDSYEPYRLITTMTNMNLDNLKTILEDHICQLIDDE